MEKIEKLTLENFKQGEYGVYINNFLLVLEIKAIYYEEEVYLSLLLPMGDNINLGACSLQEDIEDEDLGGIVEDELHFKDIGDNTIVITNNPNKF
jgi:hypothetical protein